MGNDSGIRWFRNGGIGSHQELDRNPMATLQRRTAAYPPRDGTGQLQPVSTPTAAYRQDVR